LTVRIGFVLGEFPRISETFILSQITGLLERGHEVAVYAGRPGPRGPVHPDVGRYRLLERVRYWPELSGRRLALLRLRLALLTRGGVGRRGFALRGLRPGGHDAMVAHFGHVGLEALRLREAGVLPGKLVTFFHGYDMSVFLARNGPRAYERLFRRGECFLAVSGHWQQRLEALGCPPDRTAVHRMGVDCSRFGFRPRGLDPGGAMRVVSVARLVEKKGIDCGLRAVARALCRHPGIEYTIIGDGPLRGRLTAQAAELGLSRHVRFLGWMDRERIAAELARMHVFLAPSRTAVDGDAEGVPVALIEAMACGMPVVSTRHSGIPELVEDGVSGLLVPEGDVEALADGLSRLASSPAAWPDIGRAGRAKVAAEFDIERLNDRLVERLRALATQG
jgi:colanic acid/amylovoran biosynthesis glycosyltransferase